MQYVARFEYVHGVLFRFDTRIYLDSFTPTRERESVCVGAVIGKNPGSARPTVLNELHPLEPRHDNLLPFVGNRFLEAYSRAQKPRPPNAYVRVWNLLYIVNEKLEEALLTAQELVAGGHPVLPVCPSECLTPPLVWYVWGDNDSRMNSYKERFIL